MGPGSRGGSKALPGVEAWPQLHNILLNHWDLMFSSYIAKGEEIWVGQILCFFSKIILSDTSLQRHS